MEEGGKHERWVNREKARYYETHLSRDLFGEWILVKVWGGCGTSRGLRLVAAEIWPTADIARSVVCITRANTPRPRARVSHSQWPIMPRRWHCHRRAPDR